MKIVLLGLPGSGKGTQGRRLSRRCDIPFFGVGDMLRHEVAAQTPVGLQVASALRLGEFPPNELVEQVVFPSLCKTPAFVLDGFPRYVAQARSLDRFLTEANETLDAVICLKIAEELAMKRLETRLTCDDCGELQAALPVQSQKCISCGSISLVRREDDQGTVARRRLELQKKELTELVKYYEDSDAFYEVDAGQDPEDVAKVIQGYVG